jgi:hypothetical protein
LHASVQSTVWHRVGSGAFSGRYARSANAADIPTVIPSLKLQMMNEIAQRRKRRRRGLAPRALLLDRTEED